MTAKRLLPTLLPWILLVLVGLLAAWLRYGFIEPPAIGNMCEDNNAPGWCGIRQVLVLGFNNYSYGIAALVVTLIALPSKKLAIAWLAAALGLFAVIMYCYYAGAVALLIGCLRLVRVQANRMASPVDEHRQRNGQVQPQP